MAYARQIYRLLLPPGAVLLTLTSLALIGILFSIPYIRSEKGSLREFAFVTCFFALVQLCQIVSGGVMSFARYTLTLGALAAILSGIGLARILLSKKVIVAVMILNLTALAILGSINNPLVNKIRSASPILRFVPYLHEAGEFLKGHLGTTDAVVIDNFNHEANQLAFLGGMPLFPPNRPRTSPSSGLIFAISAQSTSSIQIEGNCVLLCLFLQMALL